MYNNRTAYLNMNAHCVEEENRLVAGFIIVGGIKQTSRELFIDICMHDGTYIFIYIYYQ